MKNDHRLIEHSVLPVAHDWVSQVVVPGDSVIDATVGNGHDTLFLAQTVGEEGSVYGFDILSEALASTLHRLEGSELADRVMLIESSHASMRDHLPDKIQGRIAAVMFNLGYLPRHDKNATTKSESTIEALTAAKDLIRRGGLITIIGYTGHEGGQAEVDAVRQWVNELDQSHFAAVSYTHLNQQNNPPELIAIERLA